VIHVAFLRGVNNIGRGKRVRMAELRALFERLGFGGVRTVRNSGNVVFSSRATRARSLERRIEQALLEELEVGARVTVLAGDEVVAAVRRNPLARLANDPARCLLLVLPTAADREKLKPLLRERLAPERLALGPRAAYLWCANGVAASALWPRVDRALGGRGTARNLGTMRKLAELAGESGG
jgi:uncharacterized protein (DUF1697 family)